MTCSRVGRCRVEADAPPRPPASMRLVSPGSRFRLRLPSHPASRRRGCLQLVVSAIRSTGGPSSRAGWHARRTATGRVPEGRALSLPKTRREIGEFTDVSGGRPCDPGAVHFTARRSRDALQRQRRSRPPRPRGAVVRRRDPLRRRPLRRRADAVERDDRPPPGADRAPADLRGRRHRDPRRPRRRPRDRDSLRRPQHRRPVDGRPGPHDRSLGDERGHGRPGGTDRAGGRRCAAERRRPRRQRRTR